ncbi:3-phosphoshikimate 1-carboxyvinyltransferase [Salinimonas sp. HHU 13199]|uniref:3-phosphoshikimate 1-carboxyvinyltransferase n=1 Tax=Salinimonas profundi TaxID=2729140 RepID=A0ABR8LM89_9ALTE|nr:3-phosphoshikimate 1-carboxyvinyltransferase [Salinimonas profundi]MBD3585507.1 3-phosphoshikimate 1-carboxyvinyltransferase [Salinimonas profundi]
MYKIKHSGAQSPAVQRLLAKMPQDVADSFTEDQLEGLAQSIGTTRWKTHKVDWRVTIKLWQHRYYLVFLAGRNRRQPSRLQQTISKTWLALMICIFLTVSVMLGLTCLYVLKSALGIDLFDAFSLGIWR